MTGMPYEDYRQVRKGGPGSGFFGHGGRPGHVGGSSYQGGGPMSHEQRKIEQEQEAAAKKALLDMGLVYGIDLDKPRPDEVILNNPRDPRGPKTFTSYVNALAWLQAQVAAQDAKADRRVGRQR
jgi:hypothetical protein